MISLAFLAQRQVIRFHVEGKSVKYSDDNWKDGIQIYPLQRLLVKRMIVSRKSSVSAMGLLIAEANQGKNLEEYNSCKTEEDIADMIKKDCIIKGLVEIK